MDQHTHKAGSLVNISDAEARERVEALSADDLADAVTAFLVSEAEVRTSIDFPDASWAIWWHHVQLVNKEVG